MRKIIAVVLTVLMLTSVLAVLPVSAATATYDGTTATTEGLNTLLISEVAANNYYNHPGAKEGAYKHSLDFMEIYNNGTESVTITDLSILRAVHIYDEPEDSTDVYAGRVGNTFYWLLWRDYYKFMNKIDIKAGKIIDDAIADKYAVFEDSDDDVSNGIDDKVFGFLTNEGQDAELAQGETAIIWFVNKETINFLNAYKNEYGFDARVYFLRNFYGVEGDINPANYTIYMVWAWDDLNAYDDQDAGIESGKIATDMFTLSTIPAIDEKNQDHIFALAKNTWDLANDTAYDATNGINTDIYTMVRYGTMHGYAPTRYNGRSSSDTSAVFTFANTKPYVANALAKVAGTTTSDSLYSDYVDAGYTGNYVKVVNEAVNSGTYREAGAITWAETPTPGTLPAWHQAMINPAMEGAQTAIDNYIKACGYVDDGKSSGLDESQIDRDYNFESQEDLLNRFIKKDKTTDEEGGLETWMLILIIVGGVVVVAGIAAVIVFVVILPKKKKAAAAAAAVEAPADEAAPAEEAAAEEDKKDE